MDKKQEESILKIWNSNKFDKEAFMKRYDIFLIDMRKYYLSDMAEILRRQYVNMDVENIIANNELDEIVDFINRLMKSKIEKNNNRCGPLSEEELEEFKMFASQTEKISREELSKTAPLLTTRTYLDMCRIVYDSTLKWKYPSDISTAYLFCAERNFEFEHEYSYGILGVDWDSPKEFARRFRGSYHDEELRFGGPQLYLYTNRGDIYRQWTGTLFSRGNYSSEAINEAIRMYNALRRENYPIYFYEYEKTYSAARKEKNEK